MTTLRLVAPVCAVLALAACAWGPGTGYASVEPGAIAVSLSDAGRRDAEGRWLTSNGYRLAFDGDAIRLDSGEAFLQASAAGTKAPGAAVAFDPAAPPPGYSLCHGGHCHRADGALIDYADVEAELAAGGAGAQAPITVLKLAPAPSVASSRPDVDGRALLVPLGPQTAWPLTGCDPDCLLARTALTRSLLTIPRIAAAGTVEAGAGAGSAELGARRWSLLLPFDAPLVSPLGVAIEREGPGRYRFGGTLNLAPQLFDGLDWARLAAATTDGAPIALADDAATRETLLANFAKSTWRAELTPL